jgi:hypothetical protein
VVWTKIESDRLPDPMYPPVRSGVSEVRVDDVGSAPPAAAKARAAMTKRARAFRMGEAPGRVESSGSVPRALNVMGPCQLDAFWARLRQERLELAQIISSTYR